LALAACLFLVVDALMSSFARPTITWDIIESALMPVGLLR
jgi:hypothetical protein